MYFLPPYANFRIWCKNLIKKRSFSKRSSLRNVRFHRILEVRENKTHDSDIMGQRATPNLDMLDQRASQCPVLKRTDVDDKLVKKNKTNDLSMQHTAIPGV